MSTEFWRGFKRGYGQVCVIGGGVWMFGAFFLPPAHGCLAFALGGVCAVMGFLLQRQAMVP